MHTLTRHRHYRHRRPPSQSRHWQHLGSQDLPDELLMHALKALVRDAVTLAQVQEGAVPAAVAIPLENLEAKAAEHEITDLQPFLRGTVFDANGFEFKPDERVILKDIAA